MRSARLLRPFESMAAESLSITEQWIREKLGLQHVCLADVRSLWLSGSFETGKICRLGISLKNFVRLKSLDLSHNALESVQGIVHLELLEKLNLYYNRISSLEDVLALRKLQNLKELDLRLNPVVQKHPFYRLYLVHTISALRQLDDCPVRDRERKAALMHFSVDSTLQPSQESELFTEEKQKRSSDPRIASLNKMMMSKLTFREGNEETDLNYRLSRERNVEAHDSSPLADKEIKPQSLHSAGNPSELHLFNTRGADGSSSQDQESQPKPKQSLDKNATHVSRRPSLKSDDAPRVTFVNPSVKRCRLRSKPAKNFIKAKCNITPHPSNKVPVLQSIPGSNVKGLEVKDYTMRDRNPVLHPPRFAYRNTESKGDPERPSPTSDRADKLRERIYGKPMELILSLADEYWSGKENQTPKYFFMQAVRILCMMEHEVVSGEEELKALREEVQTLHKQSDLQDRRHHSEIQSLSEQLQRAHGCVEQLDEQLRSVLEENVSLQKQLIRLEQKLLSDQLREMSKPID